MKNERGDCWVCEFLRRSVDEKKNDVQWKFRFQIPLA